MGLDMGDQILHSGEGQLLCDGLEELGNPRGPFSCIVLEAPLWAALMKMLLQEGVLFKRLLAGPAHPCGIHIPGNMDPIGMLAQVFPNTTRAVGATLRSFGGRLPPRGGEVHGGRCRGGSWSPGGSS